MKQSLKQQKRLAARITDWVATQASLAKGSADRGKGYHKPGSNTK